MSDFLSFNAADDLDASDIDQINSAFYSRFNYPWRSMSMTALRDPGFMAKMTCQEAGDFDHKRIPEDAKIWVAGCGTNQAVITALRFPKAQVLGTDLSPRSLAIAQESAVQLGLANLTLEQASLNDPRFENAFDYVICTGVIHHNADPLVPYETLSRALRPDGLMELMVYNYYHRTHTTAYQKAIRLLSQANGRGGDIDTELPMTMEMVHEFPTQNTMRDFLVHQQDLPEPAVADSLLQPVEYSYTVETFAALSAQVGLQVLQPCVNQFDKLSQQFTWDVPLPDGSAWQAFKSLDDLRRWQVANLLLVERSPMIWFYLGHDKTRRSRADINQDFMARIFSPAQTETAHFILNETNHYAQTAQAGQLPVPIIPPHPDARAIYAACDGRKTMQDLFDMLNLPQDEANITALRVALTTPAWPYLVAV